MSQTHLSQAHAGTLALYLQARGTLDHSAQPCVHCRLAALHATEALIALYAVATLDTMQIICRVADMLMFGHRLAGLARSKCVTLRAQVVTRGTALMALSKHTLPS